MRLQVKGKNVEVSDSIRRYAEEKLAKLDRQLHELTQVELELWMEKNPSISANQVAEATIFTKGPTLRAREATSDMKASIDQLTDKLLRISQPRVEKRGLVEISMDAMRELRDASRETVQIGRRFGTEGVILEQVEGLHPLRISVDAGLRFALYNNAPGKLLLAFMRDGERDAMIRRLRLARCTARTITNRRDLARECDRIRTAGFSVDFAEADEGIHCVAAPIFDLHEEVIATIWVSAPLRRLPKASFPGTGVLVRRAADKITQRIRKP